MLYASLCVFVFRHITVLVLYISLCMCYICHCACVTYVTVLSYHFVRFAASFFCLRALAFLSVLLRVRYKDILNACSNISNSPSPLENIYKITIQNPAFESRCKNLFFLFTNPLARGEVIEGEFYPHSKIKYKAISSIVTY